MADTFVSRKRGREDGEDELQQYAPDSKVSGTNPPRRDRVANHPSRDRLYPSALHQIPDTSALSHNHAADLRLSSHKLLRPQSLQRKRARRLSNIQIVHTKNIH